MGNSKNLTSSESQSLTIQEAFAWIISFKGLLKDMSARFLIVLEIDILLIMEDTRTKSLKMIIRKMLCLESRNNQGKYIKVMSSVSKSVSLKSRPFIKYVDYMKVWKC